MKKILLAVLCIFALLVGCGSHDSYYAQQDINAGTDCRVEPAEAPNNWEVFCGDESMGYLSNGKDGVNGKDGLNGTNGIDGTNCDIAEDGAYFVMSCGEVEKARWAKAECGTTAYDPEEYVCDNGGNLLYTVDNSLVLIDSRDGKEYKVKDIDIQFSSGQSFKS